MDTSASPMPSLTGAATACCLAATAPIRPSSNELRASSGCCLLLTCCSSAVVRASRVSKVCERPCGLQVSVAGYDIWIYYNTTGRNTNLLSVTKSALRCPIFCLSALRGVEIFVVLDVLVFRAFEVSCNTVRVINTTTDMPKGCETIPQLSSTSEELGPGRARSSLLTLPALVNNCGTASKTGLISRFNRGHNNASSMTCCSATGSWSRHAC